MGYTTDFAATEPLRADIDALGEAVVVEFGVPWCPHCQGAQPLIEQAFKRYPQLRHIKVEDGPGRPLGRSFRVKLWPTLVLMRQGQEIERVVRPTELETIEKALAKLETS